MIKGINSLGIAKSHKCPNCKRTEKLNNEERYNLAYSILCKGAGMWALLHCGHCGWVDKIYPTRINGVKCTHDECEKLFLGFKEYERSEEE